jgi:O-antigen ligase
VLIVIRFFTEVVPVLPRPVQFIDIPIFVVIVGAAILRPRADSQTAPGHDGRKLTPILMLGFLFLFVYAGSMLTNPSRVDLAPALAFLYGFLGPLALFFAVYRLWPEGSSPKLSRLLVALCLVQIGVAFAINLPMFLIDQNPDVFTGTFGENPYQLVFFLLVLIGLLAGIFTFEKQRTIARFVPLLLIAVLAIIFLAQYRSLLLTTVLTVLLLGGVLIRSGGRGAVAATLAAAALLATLAFTAQNIPALKFGTTIEQAGEDPTFYVEKRLETASTVLRLFGDEPRYTITGTGPGTYSSRAWRTFAYASPSGDTGAAGNVEKLTGGRRYTTDVSDKYVVPQLASEIVGGSRAVTSPLSSYSSLLAEVGVLGFALLVAAYGWALISSLRMTLVSVRRAKPGDPLPALLCATTVAFFVLLQMAVFENWLEVTRITFLSWILFAVVTKEFGARTRDA